MAIIISNNFILEINIISIYLDEEKKGNPYNTICDISIESDGFFGKTQITTSYQILQKFINDLDNMYKLLIGKTKLTEFDFGTIINVKCNDTGKFVFEGVIINSSFQKLEFNNIVDQTYLHSFINDLKLKINFLDL